MGYGSLVLSRSRHRAQPRRAVCHSQTQTRPNRLHTHTHPPKRLTHPRSPVPPLSTLTSRATHAHPTSPRSTGFYAIWDCISSDSSSRRVPLAKPCAAFICTFFVFTRGIDQATRVKGQHTQSAPANADISSLGQLLARDSTLTLTPGGEPSPEPGRQSSQTRHRPPARPSI